MRHRRTHALWWCCIACLEMSLLLLLLLSGCTLGASSQPSPLPPAQQVLRLGLDTYAFDVNTLDPARAYNFDDGASFLTSLIFPPLLTTNNHLNPQPWAAESLPTFDPTSNTYTFTIRQGLHWSDGTPIDANTYAYSLNRSLNPCTGSPASYYLFPIKDAEAFSTQSCGSDDRTIKGKFQTLIGDSLRTPDPETLVIQVSTPAPYLLSALTTPIAFAQPEQLIDRYGSQSWIQHLTDNGGFGGNLYRVTSWNHKGTLDLAACLSRCGSASGWGTHFTAPPLRTLEVNFYQTAQDEQAAYQAGALDVGALPSTTSNDTVSPESASLQITYLQLNWAKPPFTDLRVRQAFALALNKDALARLLGLLPTNHIVPAGMMGYDPNLLGPDETTQTTGNVPLARQLLQSYADDSCHGQFSKCPPVLMLYGSGPCFGGADPQTIAYDEKAIQMWQQAFPGYPLKGGFSGGCDLLTSIFSPNAPQVFSAGWEADYADAQDWLSLQFGPEAINNPGSVDVPTANTLMAEADQTLDPTERTALYNQAEQLLITNVAWIPIGQALAYYDVRPTVAGFVFTGLGYPSLEQWYSIEMMNT